MSRAGICAIALLMCGSALAADDARDLRRRIDESLQRDDPAGALGLIDAYLELRPDDAAVI